MASEGREGEDPPMSPEEIMDTLRSMREIIDNFQRRIQNPVSGESSVKGERGGEGGGPSKPPSPSPSYSSKGSKNSSHTKKSSKKSDHNLYLLKLDVKFEFPTYFG
jgi:hypothetical protein